MSLKIYLIDDEPERYAALRWGIDIIRQELDPHCDIEDGFSEEIAPVCVLDNPELIWKALSDKEGAVLLDLKLGEESKYEDKFLSFLQSRKHSVFTKIKKELTDDKQRIKHPFAETILAAIQACECEKVGIWSTFDELRKPYARKAHATFFSNVIYPNDQKDNDTNKVRGFLEELREKKWLENKYSYRYLIDNLLSVLFKDCQNSEDYTLRQHPNVGNMNNISFFADILKKDYILLSDSRIELNNTDWGYQAEESYKALYLSGRAVLREPSEYSLKAYDDVLVDRRFIVIGKFLEILERCGVTIHPAEDVDVKKSTQLPIAPGMLFIIWLVHYLCDIQHYPFFSNKLRLDISEIKRIPGENHVEACLVFPLKEPPIFFESALYTRISHIGKDTELLKGLLACNKNILKEGNIQSLYEDNLSGNINSIEQWLPQPFIGSKQNDESWRKLIDISIDQMGRSVKLSWDTVYLYCRTPLTKGTK